MKGEFSVWLFFSDGTQHPELEWVDMKTAAEKAVSMSRGVAARLGQLVRIIITDGGDCIAFEWQFGKGVVFGLPGQEAPKA